MKNYLMAQMWLIISLKLRTDLKRTKDIIHAMDKTKTENKFFDLNNYDPIFQEAFLFYEYSKESLNFD